MLLFFIYFFLQNGASERDGSKIDSLLSIKSYATVIEILSNEIEKKPSDEKKELLARVYGWNKEYEISIELFDDLILNSNRNDLKPDRALVLAWSGKIDESIMYLEREQLSLKNARTLSTLHFWNKTFEQSLKYTNYVLNIEPDNDSLQKRKFNLLVLLNRYDAIQHLEQLETKTEEQNHLLFKMYLDKEDYGNAEKMISQIKDKNLIKRYEYYHNIEIFAEYDYANEFDDYIIIRQNIYKLGIQSHRYFSGLLKLNAYMIQFEQEYGYGLTRNLDIYFMMLQYSKQLGKLAIGGFVQGRWVNAEDFGYEGFITYKPERSFSARFAVAREIMTQTDRSILNHLTRDKVAISLRINDFLASKIEVNGMFARYSDSNKRLTYDLKIISPFHFDKFEFQPSFFYRFDHVYEINTSARETVHWLPEYFNEIKTDITFRYKEGVHFFEVVPSYKWIAHFFLDSWEPGYSAEMNYQTKIGALNLTFNLGVLRSKVWNYSGGKLSVRF